MVPVSMQLSQHKLGYFNWHNGHVIKPHLWQRFFGQSIVSGPFVTIITSFERYQLFIVHVICHDISPRWWFYLQPLWRLRSFCSVVSNFRDNQKLSSVPDVLQTEAFLSFDVSCFEDWNLPPSFPGTHDAVSTSRRRLCDVCDVE